ncbi:MAG: hypothetical protein R3280_03245 [Marinobacter sp.]|uniref:hypothetical protein n=1 Tax=Marinobacter sp. TaxID=50741 RepID=UPI00299E5D2B|nr:hypothetical protein [Marinobacter sp.]MDX1633627.1 hypothetical protein [Marinobacter sp.]
MEPIRPDDDELRAEPRKTAPQRPEAEKPQPPAGRPAPGADKPRGGGGRGNGLLVLLLVVVALAAAAGWYQQQQRIEAMSAQLEEADYWARQSKLALARFEGELSETGETLEERGTSIEQRLQDQRALIETANSEIRKLWVLANERNRAQLEAQGKAIETLTGKVDGNSTAIDSLQTGLAEARSQLASLTENTAAQGRRLDAQAALDSELQASVDALRKELNGVNARVEQQLQRFVQEQKLAAGGLEGRVSALEKDLAELERAQARISQTEARLAEVENAIDSIDAARAQLTARLVRLSEQVDQLSKTP